MGGPEQTSRPKPPSNSKAPPPPQQKKIAFKGKGKEIPPPEDLQETEEPYFSDAEFEEELKYSKKGGPPQKKAPTFDRITKEKGPSKKESLPQIKQKSKMGGKERLFNQEQKGEEEEEEEDENFLPNIQMQQVQQSSLTPPIIIKEFVILDHLDKQSNEFTIELVCNQI